MMAFDIDERTVGQNHPCYVVAEAGICHNGELALAKELVDAAVQAGADAIKFQAFVAERMCDRILEESKAIEKITGGSKSSYEMYKSLELSLDEHLELMDYAHQKRISCFSSVFDELRAQEFQPYVSCFKVSSGDITHGPLLSMLADVPQAVILSTGMSTLAEVQKAFQILTANGKTNVALLHCTANYPTAAHEVNLKALLTMMQHFPCEIGYSDHTLGTHIPVAAVALGACILEKHFTLDNALPGPDHAMALNPQDFSEMVRCIRDVEQAQGDGFKKPVAVETKLKALGRRGAKAKKNLKAGQVLQANDILWIKPASGIDPMESQHIVGAVLKQDLLSGQPLEWSHVHKKEPIKVS